MIKKKLLLTFLTVFSLGSVAQSSALSLGTVIGYFDFGYRVGVSPLLWANIPSMALGYHLWQVPQDHKVSAYVLGAAGLSTGILTLGLAVYGVKKLIEERTKKNDGKVLI